MGVNGIELVLRQRPVAPSEVYRDIVNPTGCEAAIEMPQSRHGHAPQGGLDSGPGLIEHRKVDAGLLGKTHTGTCSRASNGRTSSRSPAVPPAGCSAPRTNGRVDAPASCRPS